MRSPFPWTAVPAMLLALVILACAAQHAQNAPQVDARAGELVPQLSPSAEAMQSWSCRPGRAVSYRHGEAPKFKLRLKVGARGVIIR